MQYGFARDVLAAVSRALRRWVVAIVVVSIALGLVATRIVHALAAPDTRARWLTTAGKHAAAEAVYWSEIQRGRLEVPLVVAFLEAHEHAAATQLFKDPEEEALPPAPGTKAPKGPRPEPALPEEVVDAFLARPDLPREIALIGRFVRSGRGAEGGAIRRELYAEAAKDPPLPWSNHVLAREAWMTGRNVDAADHFEREARAFGRGEDAGTALSIRLDLGDLTGVGTRLADPRLAPLVPAHVQFRYGVMRRDFVRVARYLLPFSFPRPSPGPLLLAVIAASAWFAFCARFGQLSARARLRVPLFLAAFALGVLSIAPTMFLIVWQDVVLHLTPNGTILRDAAFYILGVGFREELSKLLLFLPLLPFLRRYGTPIDVVACGALVGLGFAAAENLEYFSRDDLASALGRFLTANFLHMSMTAIIATAFERLGRKEDAFYDFTVAFLTVITLHGVYDFFLASPAVGPDFGFLSMAVFVVLARNFIITMHEARIRMGRSKPLLPVFAIGMATVTGSSFVYASALVGPAIAAQVMFLGLLGVAILVIVFVKQLSRL